MPGAVEEVHTGRNNVIYGTSRKMSSWICYVSPQKDHVNLGFPLGTELPDSAGLLDSKGKLMRHIKLRSAADLDNPALLVVASSL